MDNNNDNRVYCVTEPQGIAGMFLSEASKRFFSWMDDRDFNEAQDRINAHDYPENEKYRWFWLLAKELNCRSLEAKEELLSKAVVPSLKELLGYPVSTEEFYGMVAYMVREPVDDLNRVLDSMGVLDYDISSSFTKNFVLTEEQARRAKEFFLPDGYPVDIDNVTEEDSRFINEKALPWYFEIFHIDLIPEDIPGKVSGYGRNRYLPYDQKVNWIKLLKTYIPDLGDKPYSEMRAYAKSKGLDYLERNKDTSFKDLYAYCLLRVGMCTGKEMLPKLSLFVFFNLDTIVRDLIHMGSAGKCLLLLRLVPNFKDPHARYLKEHILELYLEVFELAETTHQITHYADLDLRETILKWNINTIGLDDQESLEALADFLDLFNDYEMPFTENRELMAGLKKFLLKKVRAVLKGRNCVQVLELSFSLRILCLLGLLDSKNSRERKLVSDAVEWAIELAYDKDRCIDSLGMSGMYALDGILGVAKPAEDIMDARLNLIKIRMSMSDDLDDMTIDSMASLAKALKDAASFGFSFTEPYKKRLGSLILNLLCRVDKLMHSTRNMFSVFKLVKLGSDVISFDYRATKAHRIVDDWIWQFSNYYPGFDEDYLSRETHEMINDCILAHKRSCIDGFMKPEPRSGFETNPRPERCVKEADEQVSSSNMLTDMEILAESVDEEMGYLPSFDDAFPQSLDEIFQQNDTRNAMDIVIDGLIEGFRYVTLGLPGLEMSLLKEVQIEQ